MNVSAKVLSAASRGAADRTTDAARKMNCTSTRAPRNQPRSWKPGTPGPVATSASRSSGLKPAMLAGGFRRKMLNKRETTAVASANAAMAVTDARSCQKADINSSAIQIGADVANHAVTGWLRTMPRPHPIMMIATANVTRLNHHTYVLISIVFSSHSSFASTTSASCACSGQQAVGNFPQCLVSLVRRVAQIEIENSAVIQNAARIGVGAEAPLPVIFPHPGTSNAAEWQVVDQRLDRAIVHAGIARDRQVEDLLGHAMVRRKYVESEGTWPRVNEVNDLRNTADLHDREDWAEDFFLHCRGVERHIHEDRGSDV